MQQTLFPLPPIVVPHLRIVSRYTLNEAIAMHEESDRDAMDVLLHDAHSIDLHMPENTFVPILNKGWRAESSKTQGYKTLTLFSTEDGYIVAEHIKP